MYSIQHNGFDSSTLDCGTFLPAGHFTQVVWKDSTQLGVGLATDGKMAFVVGQYRPAGNINRKEYFEENVLKQGNMNTFISSLHVLFQSRWSILPH